MATKRGRKDDRAAPARGGLGRGLDALLGDAPRSILKDEAADASLDTSKSSPTDERNPVDKSRRQMTLPLEFLHPNPDQPRRYFNEDALAELSASIKARGMLQPILVRPTGPNAYEIVAGERRWRASQRAQLHEVPVVIRELTDSEAAEIALIENVQRVDLNAIEEAQAYERLADHYGRTQEAIAKAVGKSRSHVANTMRLLALPQRCIEAVRTNVISMGHARALLGADAPDEALSLVLSGELSVRETEKMVRGDAPPRKSRKTDEDAVAKQVQKPDNSATAKLKDADTRALEADLAAALGLEVSIEHVKGKGGSVRIDYLTLDQLDDITGRLMAAGV